MKDITGVPRPHIVEDFILSLQGKMSTLGNSGAVELPQVKWRPIANTPVLTTVCLSPFVIPKEHFANCLSKLSHTVLAREKECYQLWVECWRSITTLCALYCSVLYIGVDGSILANHGIIKYAMPCALVWVSFSCSYATYYETTIQSLYQQLYLKNQVSIKTEYILGCLGCLVIFFPW